MELGQLCGKGGREIGFAGVEVEEGNERGVGCRAVVGENGWWLRLLLWTLGLWLGLGRICGMGVAGVVAGGGSRDVSVTVARAVVVAVGGPVACAGGVGGMSAGAVALVDAGASTHVVQWSLTLLR